ncbi:hypothetical protein BO85DRAFT_472590 [Aspergillus piperis CBS 112811]|uniref:Uncharacterized protein n=1 Tax=Aspergillus piperis CBS 112811 TaxID=1448313 RepID=A0A8G1QUS3_9EURO|nr:hypothetical protein BO85DRAFT_472590 [Aspergillus piperis CBS 112811]RAH52590.1 hypothetical protein BO85DRAFT_472590 [Aspergillus piperis CBS 112811]
MRLKIATPHVRNIQGDREMGGEIGGRAKVYREVPGVDSEDNKIWRHLKRGERCKKRENGEEGKGDENRNGWMGMGGERREGGRENGSKVGKHKNEGERSKRFKIGGFVIQAGRTVADKEGRVREQLKGRAGRREREREIREDNYVRMKQKANFQWTGRDVGEKWKRASKQWGEERGWTDLMGWDEMDGWMDGE